MDDLTRETAEFTDVLRAWLRARREPPEVLAGAMAYELAALIALHASLVEQATDLMQWWTGNMTEQIRQLGVGVEHP